GYKWISSNGNKVLSTTSTYTVQASDLGSNITLLETATDPDGGPTTSSTSTAVGRVTFNNTVVDPRSITFTLPGKTNVTINVVEDGGNLDFTLNTTLKADLSGLYFDFDKLAGLSATAVNGGTITNFQAHSGAVNVLPNGVNLQGQKVSTFDVGIEF